jgi:hypothetical protein
LGLLACCLLALLTDKTPALRRRRWWWVTLIALVAVAAVVTEEGRTAGDQRVAGRWRNFYGVLKLLEKHPGDPLRRQYILQHGTTIHGLQFSDPQRRRLGTAYYGPDGGGGLAMRWFPRKTNRRLGVVGLGVGTLATYGKSGDLIRFYEINPEVERIARSRFTYLADSPADVEVIMSDARLSMQREAPQRYDILFLDAFSSDAIPVHLLTAEAFELYLKHLAADGVLAVHVSTHYLDLQSVLFKLAEHFHLEVAWIDSAENESEGVLASNWVLLSRNAEFLNSEPIRSAARKGDPAFRKVRLWTDDRVSLLEILRK